MSCLKQIHYLILYRGYIGGLCFITVKLYLNVCCSACFALLFDNQNAEEENPPDLNFGKMEKNMYIKNYNVY